MLQIHDYIDDTTWYQYRDHNQDMYGCLIGKSAVCAGYSQAFNYLCKQNGLDCITLRYQDPVYNLDSHLWNAVRLDGKWYQMDAEMDDFQCPGIFSYDFFLVGIEDKINDVPFLDYQHRYETDYGLTFEKSSYKDQRPVIKEPRLCYSFGRDLFKQLFTRGEELDLTFEGLTMKFSGEAYDQIDEILVDKTSRVPDYFSFKMVQKSTEGTGRGTTYVYDVAVYINDEDLSEYMKDCISLDCGDFGYRFLNKDGTVGTEHEIALDGNRLYKFGLFEYGININVIGQGTVSCKSIATAGETVHLEYTEKKGSSFVRWDSDDVVISGDFFVMPLQDVSIDAVFTEPDVPESDGDNILPIVIGVIVAVIAIAAVVVIKKR